MLDRALLYLRTVKRMRPGMVVSRLRRQRMLSERVLMGEHCIVMPHIAISDLDLDIRYLARFDVEALFDGEFLLLNERHRVDLDAWDVPEASHLWNFNLHYFEWGVALAARWREMEDERCLICFKRLIRSWIEANPYAEGDAWHPYTISLRLVNWLVAADLFGDALEEDGCLFESMSESMYRQYRHLLVNQETHLRANHWWENLKTLVILSAAFGERDVLACVLGRLETQLDEQILPDGVHFERSLMYHKLVLEGMLRVRAASDQFGFELSDNFASKLKLMLDAMASLERGMGKTPFFNDSTDGVAKECGPLSAACRRLLDMEADDSKTGFPDAGYYKLYDGDIAVMFDAGEPGPSYMLGHAHCDCLSFELSYKGEPVVANLGTYAYQGDLRPYFRSTSAHNTCALGDEEQLECWGEHRVGRGYRVVRVECCASMVTAALVLPSGSMLRRRISLAEGRLDVEDSYPADEVGRSFVHFVPSASFSIIEGRAEIAFPNSTLLFGSSCHMEEACCRYSDRFGSIFDTAREITLEGRDGLISCCISIAERNPDSD
ncbi:hypothetical protein B5F41_11055 [Gordonibacter sp. An232A]|nr:hypothetical protein B5F41_11055 [Gordonibacter sp. An232A]